jgi:catechol 2,3-dioxygenase-like lactoylglutathione lyase family enzyme
MFDHIGIKVRDLDAAVGFYRAALEPLGHMLASRDAANAGFGPPGAPALWLYAGAPGAKIHVAFHAADRRAVDRFHAAGLEAGGCDNGKPGLRTDYSPSYYAAFLLDPEGNNVEAVCVGQLA